ncbi:MAG: hypothetical protein V4663_14690 [Bacteroidota bacterium]
MSQNFKTKFDEQSSKISHDPLDSESYSSYESPSQVRNLCFTWADGKMKFLNYSYLVSGDFLIDESKIVLTFTSSIITLVGINLDKLYPELMFHIPRNIVCIETRYNETINEAPFIVNEIQVSNPT